MFTGRSFQLGTQHYRISKASLQKRSQVRTVRGRRAVPLLSPLKHRLDQQEELQVVATHSTVLQGITIYIDNSVNDKDRLTQLAHALSATVAEKWSTRVTHCIYCSPALPPQRKATTNSSLEKQQAPRTPPVVSKSYAKNMRVVSPRWLISCYDKQERLHEDLFPYDLDTRSHVPLLNDTQQLLQEQDLSVAREQRQYAQHRDVEPDCNPFGLEDDDLAPVQSLTFNGQSSVQSRRLTDYYQRSHQEEGAVNNNNNDSTLDGNISNNNNNNDNDINGNLHEHENMGNLDSLNNDNINSMHNVSQMQLSANENDCLSENNSSKLNAMSHNNYNNYNTDSDHGTMTYSLLELEVSQSSAQPSSQQQQCRFSPHTSSSITETMESRNSILNTNEQLRPLTHQDLVALKDDSYVERDPSIPRLPELNSTRAVNVTLGHEDRIVMWYGEQSFHLDDGMNDIGSRNEIDELNDEYEGTSKNDNNDNDAVNLVSNIPSPSHLMRTGARNAAAKRPSLISKLSTIKKPKGRQ